MKTDGIEEIKKDYQNHKSNKNYTIEGRLELLHDYVDITTMFNNYYEIKELNISYRAIAYNEDGFDELLDLGFPKNKIRREDVKH